MADHPRPVLIRGRLTLRWPLRARHVAPSGDDDPSAPLCLHALGLSDALADALQTLRVATEADRHGPAVAAALGLLERLTAADAIRRRAAANGGRATRLTPATLLRAFELTAFIQDRSARPLSPAALRRAVAARLGIHPKTLARAGVIPYEKSGGTALGLSRNTR